MEEGAKFFYTGKPCKYGHINKRRVGNSDCIDCIVLYRKSNKDKIKKKQKEYHDKNRDKINQWKRNHYLDNKDELIFNSRKYYKENREKALAAGKRWREKNTENIFIRDSLRRIEKNWQGKGRKAEELIGYTKEELRSHIEMQFHKGMGWDNRSEWHIDHIIPIAHFLSEGITDPKIINCLTNLKPMWAKDNISKGYKVQNLC